MQSPMAGESREPLKAQEEKVFHNGIVLPISRLLRRAIGHDVPQNEKNPEIGSAPAAAQGRFRDSQEQEEVAFGAIQYTGY